ncbi:MAG TPA: hypothetical protein VIP98_16000 [Microlunatus sp.]
MSTQPPVSQPTASQRPGFSAGRAVALVIGSLLSLIGLLLLIIGGGAAWFGGRSDVDSMMTTTATLRTPTAALVSDTVSLAELHPNWPDWAGTVQVTVRGNGPDPVFVGIARSQDVARYLHGTAFDLVRTDSNGPYMGGAHWPRYQRMAGDLRALQQPDGQSIWAASAQGTGWQDLTWRPSNGDWVLLVANADGSIGVDVSASAGVRMPIVGMQMFGWVAWIVFGTGVIFLAGGVLLIVLGARRPRGSAVG